MSHLLFLKHQLLSFSFLICLYHIKHTLLLQSPGLSPGLSFRTANTSYCFIIPWFLSTPAPLSLFDSSLFDSYRAASFRLAMGPTVPLILHRRRRFNLTLPSEPLLQQCRSIRQPPLFPRSVLFRPTRVFAFAFSFTFDASGHLILIVHQHLRLIIFLRHSFQPAP